MIDPQLYRRVADAAERPPGAIPGGWELHDVHVYGEYRPELGEWWTACAEYRPVGGRGSANGDGRAPEGDLRRLVGAGPTVRAALVALERRLAVPLDVRRAATRDGWDATLGPGEVVDEGDA